MSMSDDVKPSEAWVTCKANGDAVIWKVHSSRPGMVDSDILPRRVYMARQTVREVQQTAERYEAQQSLLAALYHAGWSVDG